MKPGHKQTEVGTIPDEWQVVPFLSAVQIANGQVDPRIEPYRSMILIAPDHIESGSGRLIQERTASAQAAISGKYLFDSGDIVYSKIRPYLRKATIAKFQGLCSADMYPLKTRKGVESGFILPVILGHRFSVFAEGVSARTGIPKINREDLSAFSIALPPQNEQRAIATALSDVDALLSSLDALIAKKRDIKQAAMQQLLTGKNRLPGFEGEWVSKRLGDVAKIQRGASPRPIDSPIWFDENSNVGWVRISDVTSAGMFLNETTQRLSVDGVKHSRPVPAGSLIMSICATVGRPIITSIDTCIHDGFVVFDDLRADRAYIYYVLKFIEPDWYKNGQTGSQMNLNTGLINSTPIKLPPREEQTAIAEVLSDMDAELAAVEARRDKTRLLKQGMMQELLTGKARLV